MNTTMAMPKAAEEFICQNKFTDSKQVYTNGSELMPVFRVEQMLDHYYRNPWDGTIEMMTSADYKERFKAEYHQTKIRYEKLHKMCIYYEAGTLDFEPTCSLELLNKQKAAMGQYLHCLEVRAQIEGVTL
jgi:hypothetical protein